MAPAKNKKKGFVASGSAPKEVVSGKKTPENNKKGGVTVAQSRQIVSDKKPVVNKGKGGVVGKSNSTAIVSDEKQLGAIEPDPQIVGKSSIQNSTQAKEAETVSQVEDIKVNKRKRTNEGDEGSNCENKEDASTSSSRHGKEKRGSINEKFEETKKRDEKSGKDLGGLIFMCNTKTKPDCFHYHVMGVSAGRKDFVMGIKPGLKLFLYDFDLKLLYGIYEASSAGGMKLEPAAFGGAFPAQVRFSVHTDCLPLPENIFKKAIKDNYDGRTHKFKTELTTSQVKHLTSLFQPTLRLHSNGKSLVRGSDPLPVPPSSVMPVPAAAPLPNVLHTLEKFTEHHVFSTDVPSEDQLFLTEQQYRSHGLRQGRRLLPTAIGGTVGRALEARHLEQESDQIQRDQGFVNREVNRPNTFFLSEKEYRRYGLRGPRDMSTEASSMTNNNQAARDEYDPYHESTTSLVNRYLSLPPITAAAPAELTPVTYPNYTSGVARHLGRTISSGERSYLTQAPQELSKYSHRPYPSRDSLEPAKYNQRYHLLGGETISAPTTVSHRYSFGGHSVLRR